MLQYNLQLFGGRGSTGTARQSAISSKVLDEDLSTAWSEDPELYQNLSDSERATNYIRQMKLDGWEDDEIKEIQEVANTIRDLSETQVVKGVNTLYRGERFKSLADAERKYAVGKTVETTQLTSYAIDKDLATSYATMYGKSATAVIITNTNKAGNFVGVRTNHFGTGGDNEVITPKGLKSVVKSTRYDKKENILYVTMENTATSRRRKK